MKKGMRPSRPSRSSSRSSSINRPSRSTGGSRIGGSSNVGKKSSSPGNIFTPHPTSMNPQSDHAQDAFDGSKKGDGFIGNQGSTVNQPYGQTYRQPSYNRPRRRWGTPLIIVLVVVICCLILLCILGIYYLVSQGFITIPNLQ